MQTIHSLPASICALLISVSVTAWADDFYLQTPQAPNIPATTFKLTDFGGVGDGKTLNTAAFAKAIEACKKAGGSVVVPAGTFVTGPIKLVSRMGLVLEKGAVIKASGNLADFGLPDPLPKTQAEIDALKGGEPLIYGSKLTDIAIRGEGVIDGNGVVWWAMAKKAPAWALSTTEAKAQPSASPVATFLPRLILDDRPNMIVMRDCERIHIQGVTFLNPPMFHFVPSRCREMLVEDVKVIAPDDSPNTDGIDPSNTSNVLIRRCLIDTGDDNIALKAGGGSPLATENITITDCTFKHGHGVSIGSETQSGMRNVLVQNCTFEGTDNGLRIKSDRTRGGAIENVAYREIKMKNIGLPITISLYYNEKNGAELPELKPVTEKTPKVRNIQFLNVTCDGARKRAGEIVGLPESPAALVKMENVSITNAAAPMLIQDAKSLEMKNVEVTMKYTAPATASSLQQASANEKERTVTFRTADQKYITASPGNALDLTGIKVGSKQIFTLTDVNGGQLEDGDEVTISYSANKPGSTEPVKPSYWQEKAGVIKRGSAGDSFKVKKVNGNFVFQTASGKFIGTATADGALGLADAQESALAVQIADSKSAAAK